MRTRGELAEMLARSLGLPRAQEAVDVAADALQAEAEMSDDAALDVLARIADQPGLIGISARFAKSRAHLTWSAPHQR